MKRLALTAFATLALKVYQKEAGIIVGVIQSLKFSC